MSIAAVVVTYNRKQLLSECLSALLNQTTKIDSVIVIDNASTDGTGEMFSENGMFNLPEIDYCPMEKNLGGAGGFYEGIKRAYNQWWFYAEDQLMPYDEDEEVVGESINRKISRIVNECIKRNIR